MSITLFPSLEFQKYSKWTLNIKVWGVNLAIILVITISDKVIKRNVIFSPLILNPKRCVLKRIFWEHLGRSVG